MEKSARIIPKDTELNPNGTYYVLENPQRNHMNDQKHATNIPYLHFARKTPQTKSDNNLCTSNQPYPTNAQ